MSRLGVAFIGASARADGLMGLLARRADACFVTGVYDVIAPKSKYLAEKHGRGEMAAYGSLQEALADKRAEVVFITTSDDAHAPAALAALKARKHIFCEKPLALTVRDCDRIVRAARRSDRIGYVGMNLRHCPVHEKIHEVVAEGRLGRLMTIEANEYYYGGRTYFRRWNRLRRRGGGLWLTKCCHDLDMLNWLAGAPPLRVYATTRLSHYKTRPDAGTHCRVCPIKDRCPDYYDVAHPANPAEDALAILTEEATGEPRDICLYNSDKDTFDNGIAVVEYASDVRATYTLSVVTARSLRQCRISGTEASLEADSEVGTVTVWRRHTGEKTVWDLRDQMNSMHGGADERILTDFFDCVRTGRPPRTSWAEGRMSVAVGLAATQSGDTGRPVAVRPLPAPRLAT